MKNFLTVVFILLFFTSCINPRSYENQPQIIDAMTKSIRIKFPNVTTVTAEKLMTILSEKSDLNILVDSRDIREQKISMIPGAITRQQFEKIKKGLLGKNIYIYSTIGGDASEYASKLMNQGFKAFNLNGGTLAWAQAGYYFDNQGEQTRKLGIENEAWNILPKDYQGVFP
ncbi:rhodanese-like domain-containing protein [Bacteriovorax sp. Seq25_V]|uniref:rhodanese-like domain-containing protein n=1 Tax=Bacteriovorax sp. Seq25_V TaxID=1201288 RepID=UPI00038A3407|nr:rhodanese-like domain-containing protein [Bacteriovorax sp. Seq25_V]EQC46152.1 hypothetical protein M900_1818 [Bacteriovorax sp. Seq25_V]